MSQRLSGFPTGLLSLVGSQSFGTAPKELGDVVAPTLDVAALYLLTKQEPEIAVIAVPAAGPNLGIVVPAGEVWLANYGGVFSLTGVGVTLDWTPIATIESGTIPIGDTVVQLASQTRWQASKQLPIWLSAGQGLGVYISALVGAPTLSVAYNISRLRA